MKRFMLLHFGFETPTPDIMAAWQKWFESVSEQTVEHGGFAGGCEISRDGRKELSLEPDAITGYSIVSAENLEEAEKLECDLLFKGAYTQSRIRQMILGGATSQILAGTTLPVFMAN